MRHNKNTRTSPLGLNNKIPLVDRYSPIAYSFALHLHDKISNHAGMETCNRLSLERMLIIQGASLYCEISTECIPCKKRRKNSLKYRWDQQENKLGSKWIIMNHRTSHTKQGRKSQKSNCKVSKCNKNESRFTTRAARSLVKIFDIEEYVLHHLSEIGSMEKKKEVK